MDRSTKVNAFHKAIEYADIRVSADGDILIAVDECGLVEGKPATIKKKDGRIFILQQGRVRANFQMQDVQLYEQISPEVEILIAQVGTDGDLQLIDQITFK